MIHKMFKKVAYKMVQLKKKSWTRFIPVATLYNNMTRSQYHGKDTAQRPSFWTLTAESRFHLNRGLYRCLIAIAPLYGGMWGVVADWAGGVNMVLHPRGAMVSNIPKLGN